MCGRHSIHICVTLHGWLQSTRSCQRTTLILVRYCLLNKTFTYSQLIFISEGRFPIHHLGTAGLEFKSPNLFLRKKKSIPDMYMYLYIYIYTVNSRLLRIEGCDLKNMFKTLSFLEIKLFLRVFI